MYLHNYDISGSGKGTCNDYRKQNILIPKAAEPTTPPLFFQECRLFEKFYGTRYREFVPSAAQFFENNELSVNTILLPKI